MRSKRTVLLLPEKIHKENDDEVVVGPDETTEQRNILKLDLNDTITARQSKSILWAASGYCWRYMFEVSIRNSNDCLVNY